MCSFLANASLNVPADLLHSDVLWLWNAVPVPEWVASDKRLHLDSSSHPPLCTLCLSGDSRQLLHLCSACKSAGQLEWPVGVDPATLNLLLPRLPATVTALVTVLLFTPHSETSSQWRSRCLNYHPQTNFETGLITRDDLTGDKVIKWPLKAWIFSSISEHWGCFIMWTKHLNGESKDICVLNRIAVLVY